MSAGFANLGADTHDLLADFIQPDPIITANSGTPYCIGAMNPNGTPYQPPPGEFRKSTAAISTNIFRTGPPALPSEIEVPTARQQQYGLYAQDTYAPNTRLRIAAGVRLDGYNFLIPDDPKIRRPSTACAINDCTSRSSRRAIA